MSEPIRAPMQPHLWLASMMAFTVMGLYLPTHAALRRLVPPPAPAPAGSHQK